MALLNDFNKVIARLANTFDTRRKENENNPRKKTNKKWSRKYQSTGRAHGTFFLQRSRAYYTKEEEEASAKKKLKTEGGTKTCRKKRSSENVHDVNRYRWKSFQHNMTEEKEISTKEVFDATATL